MKQLAAIAILMAAMIPVAQAAVGDKTVTFTGSIKADKIQPGNKVWVQCAFRDNVNSILASNANVIGTAGPDGAYNGNFSVIVNIPAATMAQIGPKIAIWRCDALQDAPGGGSVIINGGAAPHLQGTL